MAVISDPTSFIIFELTGDQNSLILDGRVLPYRPLTFEGTMRSETTWYPGNPVGTMQVLGAQESPTTIAGMWKDRFLAAFDALGVPVISGRTAKATFNGEDVANVRDLVEITDGFRMRGQLIEVIWDQFVRQGILKRFRQTWLRREDVEWEMEFEWINRGEPVTPTAFGVRIPAVDIANQIRAAIEGLQAALEAPFATVSAVTNEINNALTTIEIAAATLSDIADKAAAALLSPLEVARNTLSTLQSVKSSAQDIADTYESVPARAQRISADITGQADALAAALLGDSVSILESGADTAAATAAGAGEGAAIATVTVTGPTAAPQTTSQSETAGIAQLTHEQALEAELVKRDVRKAARELRSVATLRAQEIEAQSIRVPNIKSFTAGANDDLRDVASQFYNTQEEWKRLLTYNNLSSSRLNAGQIILIPPAGTPE